MSKLHKAKKTSRKDWNKAHIKAELEIAGWSLRRLAQHHGYSSNMCVKALAGSYPNAQRIIAEAIGVHPMEIWPSRYDKQGNPITIRQGFPCVRPKEWAKPTGENQYTKPKLNPQPKLQDYRENI